MTRKDQTAEEFLEEKCENCSTCRITGGYKYQIPDTHTEAHIDGFFDLYDYESGVIRG